MEFSTDGTAVGSGGGSSGTVVLGLNFGSSTVVGDYTQRGDIEYDATKGFGYQTGSPGTSYRQSFTRGTESEPNDSVCRCESYWDSTLSSWQALPSTYDITGLTPSTTYTIEVICGDSATSQSQKILANGTTVIDELAGGGGGNHVTKSASVTSDASGKIELTFGTAGSHVTALNALKITS